MEKQTVLPALVSDVKRARKDLSIYLKHRAGNAHIDQDFQSWPERRSLDDCIKLLPHINGQGLREIAEKLQAESHVLDYGCGDAAVALSQFRQEFPYLVCEGVTYPVDRDNLPKHESGITVYRQDGDEFLRQNVNRYDLIYSVQAFRYSPDHFRSLKLAYMALKKNGILLIDAIIDSSRPLVHKDGTVVTGAELQQILIKNGDEAEVISIDDSTGIFRYFSIAMKKTHNRLKLPFKLVKRPELEKTLFQRFNTPFEAIGFDQSAEVGYVYELMEGKKVY